MSTSRWWPLAIGLGLCGTARAQGVTGAIEGRVVYVVTGLPLAGVDVEAGGLHARTGADGSYRLTGLLPGRYFVRFHGEGENWGARAEVPVAAGATTEVDEVIGEADRPPDRAATPVLDPHTVAPAYLLEPRAWTDVPEPGLTFDAALGSVPGTEGDGYGVAFWGSSSLENRYLLDGADISELRYGGLGATVPLEFLDEIRVTGGGSTGARVEAVTKHGTNDWHGGVFGSDTPSWLAAAGRSNPAYPQTLDVTGSAASTYQLGGELSGPIVRDHLWFYAAVAPILAGTDYTRRILRQVDRDQDGTPDVDPRTGFPVTELVASDRRSAPAHSYPMLVRLDGAVTPEHQGTLSVLAVPAITYAPGLYGVPSTGTRTDALTTNASASWRSKLWDGRLDLSAALGWYRASTDVGAIDPSVADQSQISRVPTSPSDYDFADPLAGCRDDPQIGSTIDPYPLITNCPLDQLITTGGPGLVSRDVEDRYTATIAATARVRAAGLHEITVGLDARVDRLAHAQVYSGGASSVVFAGFAQVYREVRLAAPGTTDPRFDRECPVGTSSAVPCEYLTSLDDARIDYGARDEALHARDVWHVHPGLTLEAGLRLETQHLLYGSNVRGGLDPATGQAVPDDVLDTRPELAPDLGIVYDPSTTGHAKLFAHWSRSFEAIPLDLAIRASGDPLTLAQGEDCPTPSSCTPIIESIIGLGNARTVRRAVGGEYVDEAIAGGELELAGTVLGAAVRDRRLGRAIEDVLLPGPDELAIANPGDGPGAAYDPARRRYDALELSGTRRIGPLYVLASYTYSRTYGDYPGSISYDNGQLDPNNSTQYDFVETSANRLGLLPLDRPHYLKLDAAYTVRAGRQTALTIGARFRALSGTPELALAPHYLDGPGEVYLLPRGTLGRTPASESLDLQISVRRRLAHGVTAELYASVFDVLDQQAVAAVDEAYAPQVAANGRIQDAMPISGGSYADLVWAKAIDSAGNETNRPLGRNPNFHQPTAYYAPTYARIGFRLVF